MAIERAVQTGQTLPNPVDVGFVIPEGARIEETPVEEVIAWHLESVGFVANDPELSRRAALTLTGFVESSTEIPTHLFDDEPVANLQDDLMAAREAADFAKSVIVNFGDLPVLRRVLARGAREGIHTSIQRGGDLAVQQYAKSDMSLSQAVEGALVLANLMYDQEHCEGAFATTAQWPLTPSLYY